ncbi:hypothetical protein ACLOJK_026889 [Asimina triloba]
MKWLQTECMRAVLENMIHLEDGSCFYPLGENAQVTTHPLPVQPHSLKETMHYRGWDVNKKRGRTSEFSEEDEEETAESLRAAMELTSMSDERVAPHAVAEMTPRVDFATMLQETSHNVSQGHVVTSEEAIPNVSIDLL